jgi:hypothetical protein
MDEQESGGESEERSGRLGYDDLSMNVVPAPETEERTEIPRRRGMLWLVLIAVLVAVGALGWSARLVLNVPPGEEAEERLRGRLQETLVWEKGTVMGVYYVAGDRIKIDLTRNLSASDDGDRQELRKAAIEVMKVLMSERPDRDLFIDGYQGEEQVLRAEYRQRGGIVTAQGEAQPEIVVRIEGEPEGGVGTLVRPSDRGAPAG